jgi:hypothetical protein
MAFLGQAVPAQSRTIATAETIVANQELNCLDPPKDLAVGNYFGNNPAAKAAIATMIQQLFVKAGQTLPPGFQAVGDTKASMIQSVELRYASYFENASNTMGIIRAKHSSGNDPRPEGLNFIQDNGPTDVVTNPRIVVHPGGILDPAKKTKYNIFNFLESPGDEEYCTLERVPYLQNINFDQAVTGDIVAIKTSVGGVSKYQITLPSPMGPILGVFNATTFEPEGESSVYFLGNETKNKYISVNYATQPAECKKYIAAKESGDTLQVAWLVKIFDINESVMAGGALRNQKGGRSPRAQEIVRGNTTVGTTDTVVKFRSIINGVSCIHTDQKGKTTFFSPRTVTAAQQLALSKAFILQMSNELYKHNYSVIKVLQDIIAEIDKNMLLSSIPWIDSIQWTKEQRAAAKRLLTNYVERLDVYTRDKIATLNILADPTAAKEVVKDAHFISPFTYYSKGNFYKTNKSVTSFLPTGTFKFIASKFTPSIVGGSSAAYLLQGGARTLAMARKAMGYPPRKPQLPYLERLVDVRTDGLIRDTGIQDATLMSANYIDGAFTAGFLYCYVHQYHPEIFMYAEVVLRSASMTGIRLADIGYWNDFKDTYFNSEGTFEYDTKGTFIPLQQYGMPILLTLNPKTFRAIAFAELFVNAYKQLNTTALEGLFSIFRSPALTAVKNEIPADKIMLVENYAMDFYEYFYASLLYTSYGGTHPIVPFNHKENQGYPFMEFAQRAQTTRKLALGTGRNRKIWKPTAIRNTLIEQYVSDMYNNMRRKGQVVPKLIASDPYRKIKGVSLLNLGRHFKKGGVRKPLQTRKQKTRRHK